MQTSFSRRIETTLSAEELWRAIASAFRNSESQRFWPSSLESARAESLRVGSVIHVTYHAWALNTPVTYRVAELNPDAHTLTYKATKDHPLRGGATIQVQKREGNGAVLQWKGSYEHPWYSAAGVFLRFYFLDRFFAELESGIRGLEERVKRRPAVAS